MTKSEAAFRFSVKRFMEENEGSVYFWTFTMTETMPDWYYPKVWRRFSVDLQNLYGGTLRGLRVVELHETHGLHWHCLLNKRIWVGEVRRIGARYGIGRVHVRKVKDDGVVDYLAKYMAKDERKMAVRMSKWGTIGGFEACKVKEVNLDSNYQRTLKRAVRMNGGRKLGYRFCVGLRHVTDIMGELDDEWLRSALLLTGGQESPMCGVNME